MSRTLSGSLKFWLPLALWIGWIFFASGDMMSSEHTSRFLVPFLKWLNPDIAPQTVEVIQLFIRKGAHVAEYAVLAILLWRAIHYQIRDWTSRFAPGATTALVLATICAAIDEFHQSFVASRMSSFGDVLLDACGASVGLLLCWMSQRYRSSPNHKPHQPSES
jgi:VanZ family protein